MRKKVSRSAFALVIYAVVIVLWGAWVRISGSGDGCGVHWPLCHGSYLPDEIFKRVQTAIEFLHRVKSGVFGILVVILAIIVQRSREFSKTEKRIAGMALFFTVTEGLLGARLVLAGLVGTNQSTERALTVGLHLINTLFLTAWLSALWISTRELVPVAKIQLRLKDILLLVVFMSAAAFGAIASLSSTLFPVLSLSEGFAQDFSADSPWYLMIRMFHPLVALTLLCCVLWWANNNANDRSTTVALLIVVITVFFGFFTLVVLPRPSWMKLTHLCLANLAWITVIKTICEHRIKRITL